VTEKEYEHYVFDRERAPRLYAGWVTMLLCLAEEGLDGAAAKPDVVMAAVRGSDLSVRTCKNLVNEAVRKGWAYRVVGAKRQSTYLRLSEEGLEVLRLRLGEGSGDVGSGGGDEG